MEMPRVREGWMGSDGIPLKWQLLELAYFNEESKEKRQTWGSITSCLELGRAAVHKYPPPTTMLAPSPAHEDGQPGAMGFPANEQLPDIWM